MGMHESPDLVGLLGGELGRDGTIAAGRHVKGCDACTEELIDLVVAHSALSAAAHVDRDLVVRGVAVGDGTSSDAAAAAEGQQEDGTEHEDESVWPVFPPPTLTPPSTALADVPRKRRRLAPVLAAAAAIVALGAVGAALATGDHQASQRVVAQGSLWPLDTPRSATGTVTVLAQGTTRHMLVRTENLSWPGQKFYEVWLLDPATKKMLPVGVLPPSGNGEYQVTANLMAGYSAVDVSLQSDNGDPAHSQTSVLRASL